MNGSQAVTDQDRVFLRRCVDLAREALEDGDEPFGSLLVDARGAVRFEDRNRVKGGDNTRHPEFEIARWAAAHLTPEERRTSVVYTSGEHCPMCSAAPIRTGKAAPPGNAKGPRRSAGLSGFLGSPSWARTSDLRINSPSLYRLSYRGTAKK